MFICKNCFSTTHPNLVRAKPFDVSVAYPNTIVSIVKYCESCETTTTQEFMLVIDDEYLVAEQLPIVVTEKNSA